MARYKIKKSGEARKSALFDNRFGEVDKLVKESFEDKLARVMNSTLIFVFSYYLIIACYQAVSALMGLALGVTVNLHFYRVTVDNFHPIWNFRNVYLNWGIGPFVVMLIALFTFWRRYKVGSKNALVSVGLLWLAVHSVNILLGQMLMSSIGGFNFETDFYHGLPVLVAWLEWGDFMYYGASAVAFLVLILVGVLWVRPFLRLSFSQRLVRNYKGKKRYYAQVVVFPALLGSLLISLFYFPKGMALYATYALSLLISVASGWIALEYVRKVKVDRNERLQQFQFPLIAIFIVLVIVTRAFLLDGLEFRF